MDQNIPQDATEEEVKLLIPAGAEKPDKEVKDGGTEGAGAHEDDDDPEGEATARRDTEIESAATDADREAIRERRREDRRNKNQRQKARIDSLANQNKMLQDTLSRVQQEIAGLKSSTMAQTMSTVDAEIAKARQAEQHFARVEADAITKADGNTAAQARQHAQAARERAAQLGQLKQQATESANRPAPLDPAMVEKATSFRSKHNWYSGPQSADLDSKMLTSLDVSLTAEGWDPRSDAYWQELETRMAKYLPHRVAGAGTGTGESAQRSANGRGQPVAGSSSGSGTSSGGAGQAGAYRLSAERVKAMKDSGIWDDPKRRDAAIKRYQQYDADNKA